MSMLIVGLGLGVLDLGFLIGVCISGLIQGSGFRGKGLECRVWGSGLRARNFGLKVRGFRPKVRD